MSVAFVREESAEAAQEITLPDRAISPHPNLVTASGLAALQAAVAGARAAVEAAQKIEETNERRRALAIAARDARYFVERLATAEQRPEPADTDAIAFGHKVTFVRDDGRQQTYRIVGEDEAEPRQGTISYVSPLARRMIGRAVGDYVDVDGNEIEISRFREGVEQFGVAVGLRGGALLRSPLDWSVREQHGRRHPTPRRDHRRRTRRKAAANQCGDPTHRRGLDRALHCALPQGSDRRAG